MEKDNDIFDEEVVADAPKPKVEKISLKELKAEKDRQENEKKQEKEKEIKKLVDDFVEKFSALSEEEKRQFHDLFRK